MNLVNGASVPNIWMLAAGFQPQYMCNLVFIQIKQSPAIIIGSPLRSWNLSQFRDSHCCQDKSCIPSLVWHFLLHQQQQGQRRSNPASTRHFSRSNYVNEHQNRILKLLQHLKKNFPRWLIEILAGFYAFSGTLRLVYFKPHCSAVTISSEQLPSFVCVDLHLNETKVLALKVFHRYKCNNPGEQKCYGPSVLSSVFVEENCGE